MLPSIAGMAIGMISKQNRGAGSLSLDATAAQLFGVMGMLIQFLDANKNGSVIDDAMGMASKIFRK
jgi:hypothetical protein